MGSQLILSPKQKQKICPKAIHGLELLSLPITELDIFLENQVLENPLLDVGYEDIQTDPLDFNNNSKDLIEIDLSNRTSNRIKSNVMEILSRGERYCGNIPECETLHGFLRLQLFMCNLNQVKEKIGYEIIDNINDDGYFEGDLREITFYYGQDLSVGKEILGIIQSFYPKGIGARNLAECLCLQVNPEIPNYKKIVHIIENDLDLLADRKMARLSQKYHLSKQELQEVLDYVRSLNPRPGNHFFQKEVTSYIIPDIIIEKQGSQFFVTVTHDSCPVLNINESYLNLLKEEKINENEKEFILNKLNEAKTLIYNLEKRQSTLGKMGVFLLSAQRAFFEEGPSKLKPLLMKEAAEALGVHVSTISRTVQEKYIQTPWGTFPLKYFFNSSVYYKNSVETLSSVQIKRKIEEIIENESPFKPFSDQEIVEELKKGGISISRRTVAKYRQALGLESQLKRKRLS